MLAAFGMACAALGGLGCDRVGYRPLSPMTGAELTARGHGVSARIERIHVPYWQSTSKYYLDVRVDNESKENIHVEPGRMELRPAFPGGSITHTTIWDGDNDLLPGESAVYRVDVERVPLENGGVYELSLNKALFLPAESMPALPVVNPYLPHLGYAAPGEAGFVFVGRLGGGAIRASSITAGLGGLEVFCGPQFGRFSMGAFAMLGVGSVGGEVRYRLEPTRWLSIVPFAGYGYYHIVGVLGLNAGHGPRVGMEVQFATGDRSHFGWARSGGRIGIYAHVGPAFLRLLPETGIAAQGGMSFGFF